MGQTPTVDQCPPSSPWKILCPEHSAMCVPACKHVYQHLCSWDDDQQPSLGTQEALSRVVCVLGSSVCPCLMLKDQVSESNEQLQAAQNKLRTCAQNKGRSGPGVALAWIPHCLLSSTAPLGWGAHPSLLHLSPSYLDQDEAPPHNLLLGLPWACSELNVPPTLPHWTWACSGGPGHLPALSQFLMLSSGPGGTGLGSQHFLPSCSRPMPPGAVGMCRWCRGPCRT